MYFCPTCHFTSDTPSNFCSKCGSPMVEKAPEPVIAATPVSEPVAPAYTEPKPEAPAFTAPQPMPEAPVFTAPQPMPQAPVYTAPMPVSITYEPEKKKVPLGKVIAGMAIAIGGFVLAMLTVLYTFIFSMVDGEMALFFAAYLGGVFAFPLSMVGFALSKSAINGGSTSAMAKTGKILGLIGWLASLAAIAIGILITVATL